MHKVAQHVAATSTVHLVSALRKGAPRTHEAPDHATVTSTAGFSPAGRPHFLPSDAAEMITVRKAQRFDRAEKYGRAQVLRMREGRVPLRPREKKNEPRA